MPGTTDPMKGPPNVPTPSLLLTRTSHSRPSHALSPQTSNLLPPATTADASQQLELRTNSSFGTCETMNANPTSPPTRPTSSCKLPVPHPTKLRSLRSHFLGTGRCVPLERVRGWFSRGALGSPASLQCPNCPQERSSFSVTGLQFSATRSSREPPQLLATYENGVAVEWWTDGTGCSREITPSRPALVSKCGIVPPSTNAKPAVAFFMEDGTLELCTAFQDSHPTPDFCVAAGNPSDHVFQVHAADLLIGGQTRNIVAAATRAGVISIWDGETGECITILDDLFGETNSLRLSPVKPKTCQFCGEMIFDSFLLSFSVGQTVIVYRAYLMEGSTRKCSCPQNQPQRAPNVGVDFSPLGKKTVEAEQRGIFRNFVPTTD
jgi:WD40 repeat protein